MQHVFRLYVWFALCTLRLTHSFRVVAKTVTDEHLLFMVVAGVGFGCGYDLLFTLLRYTCVPKASQPSIFRMHILSCSVFSQVPGFEPPCACHVVWQPLGPERSTKLLWDAAHVQLQIKAMASSIECTHLLVAVRQCPHRRVWSIQAMRFDLIF